MSKTYTNKVNGLEIEIVRVVRMGRKHKQAECRYVGGNGATFWMWTGDIEVAVIG